MKDQNLMFDDAAALTASRVSTNVIPIGALSAGNAECNIGGPGGNALFLELHVTSALLSSGSATLATAFTTDDATGFGSAVTIFTTRAIPKAELVTDARFRFPLPPGAYEDYLRLSYTVAVADFSAGTIAAAITDGLGRFYAADSNLSNA